MTIDIRTGDCRDILKTLPDASVHCVVTSPPYFGLRDYGVDGQIGLEATPDAFVAEMVAVFREVRRVLRDDGTLWLNLGDSYGGGGTIGRNDAGRDIGGGGNHLGSGNPGPQGSRARVTTLKPKDLIGIPWRVAFALQADGWYLRQDIIWHKPNPMPESVTDRCTKAHEYVFLMSKSARYFYDAEAVREDATSERPLRASDANGSTISGGSHGRSARPEAYPEAERRVDKRDKQRGHGRRHDGFNDRWDSMSKAEQQANGRNCRSVWTIATQPFKEAHFATFPPELAERCIKAGCPSGGTVLDPFGGAGTTGLVADRLGRNAVLIELNPEYAALSERRIVGDLPMFSDVVVSK